MFRDIPEETIALLRSIANQPQHTMSLEQINLLQISGLSDRKKWLCNHKLVEYCEYKSANIGGIPFFGPSAIRATTDGLDLLKKEQETEEELSAALKRIHQLEEKAAYWEKKAKSLQKSYGIRTALWSLFVAVSSAAIGAWLN